MVSKWATKLNFFKIVQTTPDQAHQAHQAQRSSSVQIANHGREGSQAAVRTTIKWHLMKKCQINRSRESATPVASPAVSEVDGNVKSGPQGGMSLL